jgi:hypothetical protein
MSSFNIITDTDSDTDTDVKHNNAVFVLSIDEYSNLSETIHSLIQDMLHEEPLYISKPSFETWLTNSITELLITDWDNIIINSCYDYEQIYNVIDDIIYDFFDIEHNNIPHRSLYVTKIPSAMEECNIKTQLKYLTELPQPEQKTPEWYSFRHNLITASNIWKIFASASQRNSIIYEKCKPLNSDDIYKKNNWHSTGSLQWGVLYEPVSILLYEHIYNTTISDFGCIQHTKYKCIGASPDGINTDPNTPLYGRMLEVKNIVNREITGIPKEEYWIQMQIQMETCDLDECDFIETRFKEYANDDDIFTDNDHEYKGVILCFTNTDVPNSKPTYKYSPIDMKLTKETLSEWTERETNTLGNSYKYYYRKCWFLDQLSCVLVQRNRTWFNAAVPQILDTWKDILQERKDGYEHRAPKKRQLTGPCIFISKDDTVTTTRTIHNMATPTQISIVRV